MTPGSATTEQKRFQLDALDEQAAKAFEGYLVRKDLVRKYAKQYPVPTFLLLLMV